MKRITLRQYFAVMIMSYGALCLYLLATINDHPDLEYFLFFTAGVSIILGLFILKIKS